MMDTEYEGALRYYKEKELDILNCCTCGRYESKPRATQIIELRQERDVVLADIERREKARSSGKMTMIMDAVYKTERAMKAK